MAPLPPAAALLALLLVMSSSPEVVQADGLSVGFYAESCPKAEAIVRETVSKAFKKGPGTPADLIRLFFHDCFVRGCDASVLLESTAGSKAERDSKPNNPSLDGFDVVDDAKDLLEKACPQTVSCSDILALAARDSAYLAGGLDFDIPTGRRDGLVSKEDEVLPNVPHPDFGAKDLLKNFTAKGFTAEEMVTLSGAHSIGTSHCSSFTNRLYKYYGTYGTDPAMPAAYAADMMRKCPPETAAQQDPTMVQLDDVTPFVMDSQYYKNVLAGHVAFASDVALLDTPETAALVELYAGHSALWLGRFAAALVKVSKLDVLTGGEGQIRLNCSRVNS
ncbi:peroxidase 5-like [Oryza brachyantha]|uniref:Peroxidase n=1 Tax=Oryza brachyantha TaxID=4533 RepID=J3M3R4_ORYBR|nr:peroxidase 5-like [Oryza brachyantha]